MKHTPETDAINQLHFLALIYRSVCVRMQISGAENKHGWNYYTNNNTTYCLTKFRNWIAVHKITHCISTILCLLCLIKNRRKENNFATRENVNNYHRPITGHHFSHAHVTFWLGIEQCSNRRRNLVPEESGPRFAWHTYHKSAPETNGVDIWRWLLECASWV